MSKPKYYFSTAIAYTSSRPHIGNTYEIVLADSIARYKRMEGYDVYFQTGTDEHGQKIEEKANAAGITPKEYVDNVAKIVKASWDVMNTSYDKFIRTTDDYHEKQVQKIFKKLYEQGDIYKGHYEGMYCTPCESFFTESQLVDGKCPDCGGEVKPAKEEAYFFKMSKYADRLIDYINKHPEFIQPPQRKTEMMNNFLLPACRISAFPEPPSSGAFRSILTTSTSCMFGSTRSQTTSPASAMTATATPPSSSSVIGRQTCTSSARTSSVSTPSTGRFSSWRSTCRCRSRCSVTRGF